MLALILILLCLPCGSYTTNSASQEYINECLLANERVEEVGSDFFENIITDSTKPEAATAEGFVSAGSEAVSTSKIGAGFVASSSSISISTESELADKSNTSAASANSESGRKADSKLTVASGAKPITDASAQAPVEQKEEVKVAQKTSAAVAVRSANGKVFSSQKVVTDSIGVFFRQDKYKLDVNYRNNPEQTKLINELIKEHRIDSIRIYAFASPEGVYEHNQWLSKRRAETLRSYIFARLSAEDRARCDIRLFPLGEDWIGFKREIIAGYKRADREKVLKILDAEDVKPDTKKWRLKQLGAGDTFNYLIAHFAPKQRQAASVLIYYKELPLLDVVVPDEPIEVEDVEPIVEEEPIELDDPLIPEVPSPVEYKTIMALKSNLLLDAATALNASIEIPIGDKFSVLYQHTFPWWLSKDNKYCLQILTFGGEARWWFARPDDNAKGRGVIRDNDDRRLQGHYLGLYGFTGHSDVQWEMTGRYQSRYTSVGLSYGFAMPIGSWCNLEFSVAAGYARIPYQHYIPSPDWKILFRDRADKGVYNYFGPTKLEVSLVIPIKVKVGGRK